MEALTLPGGAWGRSVCLSVRGVCVVSVGAELLVAPPPWLYLCLESSSDLKGGKGGGMSRRSGLPHIPPPLCRDCLPQPWGRCCPGGSPGKSRWRGEGVAMVWGCSLSWDSSTVPSLARAGGPAAPHPCLAPARALGAILCSPEQDGCSQVFSP